MVKNYKLLTYLVSVLGALFLMLNLKKGYFDEIWNMFFVIQILFLNSYELTKFLKERKNEKNVNK
jgi:hypothetical protein